MGKAILVILHNTQSLYDILTPVYNAYAWKAGVDDIATIFSENSLNHYLKT